MSEQTWDPAAYARHAGFVPINGMSLIEWLSPKTDERILDLGCGDGNLTAKLAEAGCSVIGIDSSTEQVHAARGLGLDARVIDARRLPFDAEFDAVLSNAALHWIKDADAVAEGVYRSLKPGGRFVAEMGGAGNVAVIRGAVYEELRRHGADPERHDPWYFPTPEEYRGRLEAAGLVVHRIDHFPRPTRLPTDVTGWLETFAGSFATALPVSEHANFFAAVQERVRPSLQRPDGTWWLTDYWRLRFVAVKPSDAT